MSFTPVFGFQIHPRLKREAENSVLGTQSSPLSGHLIWTNYGPNTLSSLHTRRRGPTVCPRHKSECPRSSRTLVDTPTLWSPTATLSTMCVVTTGGLPGCPVFVISGPEEEVLPTGLKEVLSLFPSRVRVTSKTSITCTQDFSSKW